MPKTNSKLRLVSWNVNGIRACLAKGMKAQVAKLDPDILCLQETKADEEILKAVCEREFPHYQLYSSHAQKKGYSGVATLVKKSHATLVKLHDTTFNIRAPKSQPVSKSVDIHFFSKEGRFSILRTAGFALYNLYIPSGTSGESRQALKYVALEHLLNYFKSRSQDKEHPIILCGDFNICHKEIDIHHPKEATQRKLTGFLPDERLWMDKLTECGLVDCFRARHGKEKQMFSWWSYRAQARKKNLGWRLDYFFCSESLRARLLDSSIHCEVQGSDHCPVSVEFRLP